MESKQDLGRLVLNLANTIIHNRNQHLEALGLTSSQADCMKFFIANEKASIKTLKTELKITHQTAQGLVSRLIEKGFLSAEQSQNDKRYQLITATETGLSLSEKLKANGQRTASLLVKGMTEEEKTIFIRLLGVAYENVKNDGKEEKGNVESY